MHDKLSERVEREKASYDQDQMEAENIFSLIPALECIQRTPSWEKFSQVAKDLMKISKDKEVLELGSQAWPTWIDFINYRPKKVVCINISEIELLKGVAASREMGLGKIIDFQLMDAHFLTFPDATFDLVYGGAILHHLDIATAIKETRRVLRPGGVIIFSEPLIHNPVAKLVRLLTPQARTPDEKPLGIKELKIIDKYFVTQNYYTQLFDIPLGIVSSYIYNNQDNTITRFADKFDSVLKKLPCIKYLFRYVLIYGVKR